MQSVTGDDPRQIERTDDGPVRLIPGDKPRDEPQHGMALCLSGGGYRAMLFHLGGLWRLNEMAFLPRLDRISSVSGGSITAGALAFAWPKLAFGTDGVAPNFAELVAKPIRRLASRTIDVWAILLGMWRPGGVSRRVAKAYRTHLFSRKTLADLPEFPRFVINSTNLQSCVLWRFSQPYSWDYRVGKPLDGPQIELATAVAASSSFPPALSPTLLRFDPARFEPGSGTDLEHPEFRRRVILSDGGVYDNLGLETAWKRYRTILVSDGGGATEATPRVSGFCPLHLFRVLSVIDSQVRSLRKRLLIDSYTSKQRNGAYWSIRGDIADYGAPGTLPCPHDETMRLAAEATRLKRLDSVRQEQLINWGYAMTDAAIRTWLEVHAPPPKSFPYPSNGLG